MPERLVVEPDELRRIAKQHEVAAAKLREWGVIPHAWLDEFPDTYGSIADPMHGALVDYYNKRHDRAERLAINHEQTRDQLLAAAKALEDNDEAAGRQVAHAGGHDHGAPSGDHFHGAPTAPPMHTGTDAPIADSRQADASQPAQPSVAAPPTASVPDATARSEQGPSSPPASAPQTYDTSPTGAVIPIAATAPSVGASEHSVTDMSVPAVGDAGGGAGMTGGSSPVGGMPLPLSTDPVPAKVASIGSSTAARVPAPLAVGPFAAAVRPPEDRRALPSFVVGAGVDDDLALARTLLAATLAAVRDSALGLEWAAAVWRTSDGPIVLLTSTEGRGWLPPGLFLPLEVTLPWRWDTIFGTAGREAIAALEETADPARILAEFGLMLGRRRSIRISALASSAAIPDNLRAGIGDDIAMEGWVSAAESAVDFTEPGVGLVDRLALAGSNELLRQAATVPEAEIRAKCVELAVAADAWVRAAVSSIDAETHIRRARRRRILDALLAGYPAPVSWWDQIRAADDMTAAVLRSRRVDVSYVPVGGVCLDTSTEALRSMVFERRADELLMLLAAGEPDRQTLRDALYAYGQITEHPQLPAAARIVAAQETDTTSTGMGVPDVTAAHSVRAGAQGISAVSVGSIRLGGAPQSIDELLKRPAEVDGASEQRRG